MRQHQGECRRADGLTVRFAVTGQGEPLVMVSPPTREEADGFSTSPVPSLLESLSAQRTVIRLLEPLPSGTADLEAVAAHLGLERFDLLAVADGVGVAADYAARYPARVARLALLLAAASDAGAENLLGEIRSPTLVAGIGGEHPEPDALARAVAAAIPDGRALSAPDLELDPNGDRRERPALLRELLGFLAGEHTPGAPRAAARPPSDLSAFLVTGGALRAGLPDEVAAGPGPAAEAGDGVAGPDEDLVGETVGRYRVEERIGVGGMGVVYRAVDSRLGRQVAVKLLPAGHDRDPGTLERFEREALTVSRLSHPGICVLHEIGEHHGRPFLVLELLEGETLERAIERGPIEPVRALEIAAAAAEALAAAHSAGILHRDVKPANLFLTRGGHVKILDFGIAKLTPPPFESEVDPLPSRSRMTLTRPGTTLGTLAFMSPEQVRHEHLDGRTDLFSLGAVLYEMLTGRRAFAGPSAGTVLSAILRDDPPSLTAEGLDPRLQEVVSRALCKEPAGRWQSATELRDALLALRLDLLTGPVDRVVETPGTSPPGRRRWASVALAAAAVAALAAVVVWAPRSPGTATTRHQHAVAVLPFEELGPEPLDPFLALAVPDEVASALARSHELAVRPFAETRRVDPSAFDPAALGAELGADHLIAGRLSLRGGALLLGLEAIEVAGERVVWKETVSLPSDDLIAMRRALARRVRDDLLPALGASADDPGSAPASSEAYRLYLESLPKLNDPEPNEAAIALLETSVELDPGFAPAWGALGRRLFTNAFYWGGGSARRDQARAAVERALALDPDLADAAGTLVDLQVAEGEVVAAFDTASRLVEHRPRSSFAHALASVALRYGGQIEDAVAACARGEALDPRDPRLRACSWSYLWSGDLDRAAEFASRASSILWQNDVMARIALMQGRRDEALRRWRRQLGPEAGRLRRDGLVACLEERGREDTDRWFLSDFDDASRIPDPEWKFWSAGLYVACGYEDLGLVLLRQAAVNGYCVDPSPRVDPLLEPLAGSRELEEIRATAAACRERIAAAIAARGGSAP